MLLLSSEARITTREANAVADTEVTTNQRIYDEQHRERFERDHKGRVALMCSDKIIDFRIV